MDLALLDAHIFRLLLVMLQSLPVVLLLALSTALLISITVFVIWQPIPTAGGKGSFSA